MAGSTRAVLLTRPLKSSETFANRLRDRLPDDVAILISPIIEIADHGPLPDVTPFETVILTSRNAVDRLGGAGLLEGRKVATVGGGTAKAARDYGATAESFGQDAAEFLAKAGVLQPPCIHCRGVHTRGSIAQALRKRGIATTEAVIYDQKERPLSEDTLSFLAEAKGVVVPVFSPRSARLLREAMPASAAPRIVAISPAAASNWHGSGEATVAVAPTASAMVDAIVAAL